MSALTEQYRPLRKFSLGDKENLVIRLVLINLIIFAGLLFAKVVYKITNAPDGSFVSQVIPWAVLSAEPMTVLTHPWTLFTYMFVHTDFWLLLSCMIWLWGYGEMLQGLYGSKVILPLYILGGFAGAVVFLAVFQFFPALSGVQAVANSAHVGASASVTAIVICTTVLLPKYRVFPMLAGGIPLYVITIIYLVFSFLGMEGGMLYSHLGANVGGLLLGAYFGYKIKNGYQPGEFVNTFIYKFSHLFEPKDKLFTAENKIGRRNNPDKSFEHSESTSDLSIDEILDKINESGIKSLTDEEKDFLVRLSRSEK